MRRHEFAETVGLGGKPEIALSSGTLFERIVVATIEPSATVEIKSNAVNFDEENEKALKHAGTDGPEVAGARARR